MLGEYNRKIRRNLSQTYFRNRALHATDGIGPTCHQVVSAGQLSTAGPAPRLIEELTAGLSQRLTLISAPAGYGKTTVVNQWLDSVDLPCAWISLDEHDGDLANFLGHFLAAV